MLSVYSLPMFFQVPCRISALKFWSPPDQCLRKHSALPLAPTSSAHFRCFLQNPFSFNEKIVQDSSGQDSTRLHPASCCLLAVWQCRLSTLPILGYEQATELLLSSLSTSADSCLHPYLLFSFCLLSPNLAPALCSPTLKIHTTDTAGHWVFCEGTYSLVRRRFPPAASCCISSPPPALTWSDTTLIPSQEPAQGCVSLSQKKVFSLTHAQDPLILNLHFNLVLQKNYVYPQRGSF